MVLYKLYRNAISYWVSLVIYDILIGCSFISIIAVSRTFPRSAVLVEGDYRLVY